MVPWLSIWHRHPRRFTSLIADDVAIRRVAANSEKLIHRLSAASSIEPLAPACMLVFPLLHVCLGTAIGCVEAAGRKPQSGSI
jgi:hypothetical protein